ncbi:GTPase [Singulisphaera sp. PoT]|uniref:GTPase n=1 Tax=Singulisphaera sp. PoT TaxID=3411797 RepID=UPI003BF4FC89
MLRNWRAWVLLLLLVGPILVYIGLGALWLKDRGWLLIAGLIWIATGVLFSVLASLWTKSQRALLPPLDWEAPNTFSDLDRKAWSLVENEAEAGDKLAIEVLTGADVYINSGRRLAQELAEHYHPLKSDPLGQVPFVEFMTAMELAAEDLNRLCRQVPGGDMLTASHLKQAVQVAGYLQRANDIYSYLLPIFNPMSGLMRLGAQQWMAKPAWKNMQQNLLRWFYRAYVNRLGVHLIELYSGRLVIGAEQYRRLTRKGMRDTHAIEQEMQTFVVAVVGAKGSGKSRLVEVLEEARSGDLTLVKARLEAAGLDQSLMDRLKTARFLEVPGYSVNPSGESARDRSTRREAVELAVQADILFIVVNGKQDSSRGDVAFAEAWNRWYLENPRLEIPPAMAVVTMVDSPEFGSEWKPPYDWTKGNRDREAAVRARLGALRAALPPTINEMVAVGLEKTSTFGIVEHVLPTLATLLHRAERVALIRHLHEAATRSKARRLVDQFGRQGKLLWNHLRESRKPKEKQDTQATQV